MDDKELRKLILYIAAKAREGEYPLTRIRLMKLLYFIDESYYEYNGKIFTGLDWIYYHYGPYTAQIQDTVDRMVGTELIEKEFDTNKTGYKYLPLEFIEPKDIYIKPGLLNYIDSTLHFWQDKNTNIILDYVYKYSLPMSDVKKGDSLSFNNITKYKEQLSADKKYLNKKYELYVKSKKIKDIKDRFYSIINQKDGYKFKSPSSIIGKRLHIERLEYD